MAFLIVVGSILCLWFGPNYLNDNRRVLGFSVIVGGWIMAAFGLGLCLPIGVHVTWGWPF